MTLASALDLYEVTVGMECHVQLKTKTKLFSGADNDARDKSPNTVVSPICFGLPGTLPVLNRHAIELAVRAGAALNAKVAEVSNFDRKHYFYPDLPKGYQITQLDRPIIGKGEIEVPFNGGSFTVGITRAHMEEDAGKLVHPPGADYSLVDYNRAGTPLIEIVSEPDIHSAAQARAYVQELWLRMMYSGVTEGNLYYGNMRFDVNVSVAKKGSGVLGTRTETKNLNSFRSVERAVDFEFRRQVDLVEKGQKIVQETRGFNDATQKTFSQRTKEDADDYRYFPEADIPPVVLTREHIREIHDEVATLLPAAIRARLSSRGLKPNEIETLLEADAVLQGRGYIKLIDETEDEVVRFVVNWILNRDIASKASDHDEKDVMAASALPTAVQLSDVFRMYKSGKISSNNSDELIGHLAGHDELMAESLADEKGMLQVSDSSELEKIIDQVLSNQASQKAVADIKAGKMNAIGFLVGQVMKESRGTANPGVVSELVRKKLLNS